MAEHKQGVIPVRYGGASGYRATCSCGWRGPIRFRLAAFVKAEEDAERHRGRGCKAQPKEAA